MQGILDTGFLLLHLRLGGCTNIDNCHTTCDLSEAFLEFFPVVVRARTFDLAADLMHPRLDVSTFTSSFYDDGIFFINSDALGAPEIRKLEVFKLEAEVFGNEAPTGKNGYIFKHILTTVAEPRGFDRTDFEHTPEFVDNECS